MLNSIGLGKEEAEKFIKLKDIIQHYKSAVIAFSGGIDSTLLAYISHHILSQNVLAVTINSEFFSSIEFEDTRNLADKLSFNHKIIETSVLNNTEITQNNPERCKYCKELVFKGLIELAKNGGYENVIDGSNIDDLKDYRPGFEAVKKLGLKSPFIETGINKTDIRKIAKELNLPNWDKPASACLASRIPYGTKITEENLKITEQAETYLVNLGYKGFRVRYHNQVARIELNPDDIEQFINKDREKVDLRFKELGYSYSCLDLKGYRTGSLNEVIK